MIAFSNMEYTIELTEALSEIEVVILMLPERDAKRFSKMINKDVNIEPFYNPRMRYPANILMLLEIIYKIKRFKPDIVHLQKGHPWFNCMLPVLKRYCLITTIHDVTLHTGDKHSKILPSFTNKIAINCSDKIIVHGDYLKEEMVKEYKVAREDVHVLKRGVNSIYTRCVDKEKIEERNMLLFFGRIWEYKGLKYLIEAEPIITKEIPDVKIVIAGQGEDFKKYRDMMVNKENYIVYNKNIPDTMVAELFQRASIVILPYIDGSQSGVIPQAYAFRKPVVVTKVGSLPEIVDDGITGCIVPPRDTKKLAGAIIDLLKDDERRKKMGENGYKKTREDLAWKNIAPKTIEVYKKALSKKRYN